MGKEKKVVEEDEGPSDAWLASYADAMTLLLAFFIMMFAFALIDEGKFFDFKVGVTAALGIPSPVNDSATSILSDGEGHFSAIGYDPVTPPPEVAEEMEESLEELAGNGEVTAQSAEQLAELLRKKFDYAGVGQAVDVGVDSRGVYIRFAEALLFNAGDASLNETSMPVLATASTVLGTITNPLEVEGHTDSDQVASRQFASNWDLSVARSASVVNWLSGPGGITDARLTAIGKAATKPVADNATAEGRAQNRRVEIVTRISGAQSSFASVADEPSEQAEVDEPETPDTEETADTGETVDGADPIAPLGEPDVDDSVIDEETEPIAPIEDPILLFPTP